MLEFDHTVFYPGYSGAADIQNLARKLINESEAAHLRQRAQEFIDGAADVLMEPLLAHGVGETPEEYKATVRAFFAHIGEEICADPYDGSDPVPVNTWVCDAMRWAFVAPKDWKGDLGEGFTFVPEDVFDALCDEVHKRMKALAAKVYD